MKVFIHEKYKSVIRIDSILAIQLHVNEELHCATLSIFFNSPINFNLPYDSINEAQKDYEILINEMAADK